MMQEKNQEETQTLTNPLLNHSQLQILTKIISNSSHSSHQMSHSSLKNEARKNQSNLQSTQKEKLINIFKTQTYFSPEIKKQTSHHFQTENMEEFKQLQHKSDHHHQSIKMQEKQQLTSLKLQKDQKSKSYFKPMSLKEKQRVFQEIKKQSQKMGQKSILLHDQTDIDEDISSDEDFQDRFILSGANLQKTFVTLTIEEKKIKLIGNTQAMDSQQFVQQLACQKMQIQRQNNNFQHLKFEQNQSQKQIHDHSTLRQQTISFSLKDARSIRQIRFFTPIKSLKRYILRKFGYSQGARNCQNLQISFYNLYPNQSPKIVFPIANEQNLQLIVLQFIKAKKDLFIRFENDGSLRKKVERKQGRNQVQFDSDGELQDSEESQNDQNQNQQDPNGNHYKEIKEMIRVNKTQKSRYRGVKPVRCAFCHKTNKDIENIKICGPFYGPFLRGKIKTKHYTHLLCALWCKKVYLNDDNELKEIASQINRSQRKECKYCEKKGAGLLCHGCSSSMHYECGLGKCEYLWSTYELYCDKCHQKYLKHIEIGRENQQDVEGQLIEISSLNVSQQDIIEDIQLTENNEIKPISQLSINQTHNITGPYHQNSQQSNSRTQSLNVNKPPSPSHEKINLRIDMCNRIQINNETPDVEILQAKCKPPKKISLPQVKIQEQQVQLRQKEKPRRGRRQKKKN